MADEDFGGRVGRTFAGSQGWWPPRPSAPEGAPNVVVVLADDLGFSDLGCYGSEIATPNLDDLASSSLRFSNFHVTPMCSPTRAALLTGVNPHAAGVGHVSHSDPGFPGYASELAADTATLAETLREAGYATLMVGKWHLSKDSDLSDAGPKHSWPCQRGFDRFYGILDGFTNLHHPHRLVEDNHTVEVDRYPDGYYFTDDITDRALSMIKEVKASDPGKPFFLYLAHGAVHAPLHAKEADIARYADRYGEGWDAIRSQRFERAIELGIVPEGTRLPPRNSENQHDVPAWDDLSEQERELYARYMAAYAGMVDNIDQNFGRLRDALAAMGELENTIVVFTSDNGASREGEEEGTSAYYVHLLGARDLEADLARLDDIGGPKTTPHYPRGWAMACNSPFRLYKINTHAGGHQVPMIFSWPRRFAFGGEIRPQYVYVTDIAPTLLELIGVAAPAERTGVPLKPFNGTSFVNVLEDAAAASRHTEQYSEMIGHRGYYRDGWEVVTLHLPLTPFGDHEWELYDLSSDPTEIDDLAIAEPDRVLKLASAWEEAAQANQVYPLDEGSNYRYLVRPPYAARFEEPVTIYAGTPTLERWRSLQLILVRSFDLRIDLAFRPGDEGVLLAHGDQGGGYLYYVEDDVLRYAHNDGRGRTTVLDCGALSDGASTIDASYVAPGGYVWALHVRADGQERLSVDGLAVLYPMAPFEGIDVGIDRRSPVSWELYERRGPFPFTGELRSVTYTPGAYAPDSPPHMIDALREMGRRYE